MSTTTQAAGTVKMERTFNAPIETVWQALTDIDQMKQWYFDVLPDFKPQVGFETRFTVTHEGCNYPHIWKVTRVEPMNVLAYEWRYDGKPGNSLLTFYLEAVGNKTKLTLVHENLDSFRGDLNPDFAFNNFVEGWNEIIGVSLKKFLEGNA